MTRLHLALACLALVLPACLPTDACGCSIAPPYTVDADSTEYTAQPLSGEGAQRSYGFRVVTRFRNWSSLPVYLDRCSPDAPRPVFAVTTFGGGPVQRSAYDPAWACTEHDEPIVVQPGATRTDTLALVGPTLWDASGKAIGALEGTFRIRLGARNCRRDTTCLIPEEYSSTQPIRVRLAR